MNDLDVTALVKEVVSRLGAKSSDFEVEASGRHVHLDRPTIDALFGEGYQLTKAKDLSQPGQYACKERISLVGPKGVLRNVIILGPERNAAQVEVSATDAMVLGTKAPVRESGDITGTPGVLLMNGAKAVQLDKGLIVAKRHVHMTEEDAAANNVVQGEIVQVRVEGQRPLIFDDVVIRVNPKFATFMHIDYDEANACGFVKGTRGTIIKKTV
ncbi:ethanolamine utilization phosphate acetyltransferase EutD [Vagococcus intermedius]|uniref:Phosphate propanoyltransferase n=1 Tax=Vagococcus intermedius TaxID=2991418 RepID=A0AAF0CTN9_9ENTE|nr:ethanolamine utilization phosphate acetyltransferase EutD [Vagococcus intermedius]WEG72775.1 ethanolamine utilization phosphate acetyltransferase EutD [Vagococcus intermedius]WEG74860.1 ethanolamine utilization phosphate acetyltransferase EutD [Vagococcus intermedius]